MKTDEKRLKQLAAHLVIVIADTIMQGFSYQEGIAMFQTMAETMVHIDKTHGSLDEALDVALLSATLRAHLEKQEN